MILDIGSTAGQITLKPNLGMKLRPWFGKLKGEYSAYIASGGDNDACELRVDSHIWIIGKFYCVNNVFPEYIQSRITNYMESEIE